VELTQDHLHVAFSAWAAAQNDGGVVLEEPGLYPAAHQLAEQGWLQRRFVTDRGEPSWWWSPRAELALERSALADVTKRKD